MIYRHKWKDHESVYIHSDRGFCKLTLFEAYGKKVACLHDLIVYPEKRGQGYGRFFLAWAIGRAVLEDCDVMILWPDGEPWVIEWYKRTGFEESREFENEDGEPCLAFRLNSHK